ncbi:MAG: GNAT family N-acetyltransferase [Chloroflexi bacterium]|nr:GNAT family N-acetyltransferase [Chloroflexota bacterium]
MVARALSKSSSNFHGARLFDPSTDLNGVAHLLEEAFRPDNNFPFSTTPWLREFGIALWTMSYSPGMGTPMYGLVWVEDGKIVGNVSLNPDYNRSDRYYISNVAVKIEYRRQGIARALMQATFSYLRERQVRKIFLNVRPNNDGAIKLYKELGFKAVETRGEWSHSALRSHPTITPVKGLRPLRSRDHNAVSELLRLVIPENAGRYRPESNIFTPAFDERIAERIGDFFVGQTTRRWILERDGRPAAVVYLRGQNILTPHRFVIQVHPDFRGRVESSLVNAALEEIAKLPLHPIRADAATSHPELVDALEQEGFYFHNGLTLMELDI